MTISWPDWVRSPAAGRHYLLQARNRSGLVTHWHRAYVTRVEDLIKSGKRFCIVVWADDLAIVFPIEWYVQNITTRAHVDPRNGWIGYLRAGQIAVGYGRGRRIKISVDETKRLVYPNADAAKALLDDDSPLLEGLKPTVLLPEPKVVEDELDSLTDAADTGASITPTHSLVGPAGPRRWWVNQGSSYRVERDAGILWAPEKGRDGRPRDYWSRLADLRPGELVLHNFNGRLVAVSRVTSGAARSLRPEGFSHDDWQAEGTLVHTSYRELRDPILVNSIPADIRSSDAGPFTAVGGVKQGYLFAMAEDAFARLCSIFPEILGTASPGLRDQEVDSRGAPIATVAELAATINVPQSVVESWILAIRRKRQAVFYGPPGTGKTFVAEHVGRHLISDGNGFSTTVQFHPSTSYEEFVEGRRPEPDPDGNLRYPVVPGLFRRFCEEADRRTGSCVLVIDEFNRANVSQVLGELLFLLEYRDRSLVLSASRDRFRIPPNVYLLGTMNTADRSIALVDMAMRRRFAFIPLRPDYDLIESLQPHTTQVGGLVAILREINTTIEDPNLAVGPSFFLHVDLETQLESIWKTEIEPYLEEVFFESPDKVEPFRWTAISKRLGPST